MVKYFCRGSTKHDPGTLLFLIYINDLSDNLSSNPKLLAYDTLLFSVVCDKNQSGIDWNDDLESISNWAFQWKISFNPDSNKQVSNHQFLSFNGTSISQSEIQKHLGMLLDSKLDFKENIKNVLSKVSKTLRLLCKLQKVLPIPLFIYKASSRFWIYYFQLNT